MSQTRRTQRDRILGLLIEARHDWVPLPKILELGIAQFGARIKEARALGFDIENRTEIVNGAKHSWYRLRPSVAPQTTPTDTDQLPVASQSQLLPAQELSRSSMLAHELGRERGGR